MISVLISAYAVSPNHGSEPGVGWNWIIELAKYCKVFVITEAEFKAQIDKSRVTLPQKGNLMFYYNDIGQSARQMCWNQGDYRFYHYYRKWQQKSLLIAKEIINEYNIDILHQLNMIGYREPGYLWKIEGIPFVWGPIGGFSFVKYSFLMSLGLKWAIFYSIKNMLNYIQAKSNSRVKKAIRKADLLLAASDNTKQALKKFYRKNSILINETGCQIPEELEQSYNKRENKESFDILWVGRFIPTKMLGLAIKTISEVKHLDKVKFHIVGNGNDENIMRQWKGYAKKHDIENNCLWYGRISQAKVQDLMKNADLLFFSSIVEGTSHVILESISNYLPILCFDSCGHGEIVTDDIGRKIKLETPKKAIEAFAIQLEYLYNNRELLNEMSINCGLKITNLSWREKGKEIFEHYKKILEESC